MKKFKYIINIVYPNNQEIELENEELFNEKIKELKELVKEGKLIFSAFKKESNETT